MFYVVIRHFGVQIARRLYTYTPFPVLKYLLNVRNINMSDQGLASPLRTWGPIGGIRSFLPIQRFLGTIMHWFLIVSIRVSDTYISGRAIGLSYYPIVMKSCIITIVYLHTNSHSRFGLRTIHTVSLNIV